MSQHLCTTKSPLRLAEIAYRTANAVLPPFRSPYGRRDFSEPQYFALLALRVFFRSDYRGVIENLRCMPAVLEQLELTKLPHFSTLCRAHNRLREHTELLAKTIAIAMESRLLTEPIHVAVDATGLETRNISPYFFRKTVRGDTSKLPYPKLNAVFDTRTHLAVATLADLGPSQDSPAFTPLLRDASSRVRIRRVLGDKGYDAEKNHELCRLELAIPQTVIPPRKQTGPNPSRRWPKAKYRRMMKKNFWKRAYGQRWQAESAFSQTKRLLASHVRARKPPSQNSEVLMKPIVLNLMILAAA